MWTEENYEYVILFATDMNISLIEYVHLRATVFAQRKE